MADAVYNSTKNKDETIVKFLSDKNKTPSFIELSKKLADEYSKFDDCS